MNCNFFKTLFLCVLCMLLGANAFAAGGQKATVDIENGKLKSLFEAIEKQTSYVFSYRDDALEGKEAISIKAKDAPISQILDKALEGTSLSYQIVSDKSIIISDKSKSGQEAEKAGMGQKTKRLMG